MDASLKETEYDVILIGTGMVEAILAGALARNGKNVLHLDQNDYYGSNYASFPFVQFVQWVKHENIVRNNNNFMDATATPKCQNETRDAPTFPLDPKVHRILPLDRSRACHLLEEKFATDALKQKLIAQSSFFNIDISPRLLLASEELVDVLITSGVGRYLEFAAIEHTYVHFPPSVSSRQCIGAETRKNTFFNDTVWEVPCSKKAVFQSHLLTMVEKRQLMHFLQFVADYGETYILQQDVKTKNERSLALGRALKRPQNKQSTVAQDTVLASYRTRSFQELLDAHFHLTLKLQQVVLYCVALASFPPSQTHHLSTLDGLQAVYRYVASIGRFTSTAFLAPLYGISELAQSFCRLSAVYGGLYVLRAPVDGIVVNTETNQVCGVHCHDGDVLRAKQIVTNGTYGNWWCTVDDTKAGQLLLRGVFVLTRSLRDQIPRFMLIVPPNDDEFKNPSAVHVLQLDAGSRACPDDLFLVQMTMVLPLEWIEEDEKQKMLLFRIIRRLLLSADPTLQEHEHAWEAPIAWRALFRMEHLSPNNGYKSTDLPLNAWIGETGDYNAEAPLEIHLESTRATARALFDAICPQEPFLPKSASAEQAEEEEKDQEEELVLQAAQKLVLEEEKRKKEAE